MSLERLENAHAIMVRIVACNPEGRRLVPIVNRLESEIATLRSVESDYDRILQLAKARQARSGASTVGSDTPHRRRDRRPRRSMSSGID